MASVEALAIQREQFEREQNERLERIEAKQDEILDLLRELATAKAEDTSKTADKKPAGK